MRFRRVYAFLIAFMSLIIVSDGCRRELTDMETSDAKVSIKVRLSMSSPESRSGYDVSQDMIDDINLFVYSGGRLVQSLYTGETENISVEVTRNKSYRIYAVGNIGKADAPTEESDLAELPCSPQWERGLPVCAVSGPVDARQLEESVELSLKRLVARYNFSIDKSRLTRSKITITSVRIRQCADEVYAFGEKSAARNVSDGDTASAVDIETLNSGGSIMLYVPENCQGVLLPTNDDEWRKVPDNIPEKKDVCTYIEVKAKYVSLGLDSENVCYRMYLGKDNVSDFDIVRNTNNTLVLTVTDKGVFRASWRVDAGDMTDSRVLYFMSDKLDVFKDGLERTVGFHYNYSGEGEYEITADEAAFEAAGLTYSVVGRTVKVKTSKKTEGEMSAMLFLSSWDGNLRDTCMITVRDSDVLFTDFVFSGAEYLGQWGTIVFNTFADEEPVSVTAGGVTFAIGDLQDKTCSCDGHCLYYYPEHPDRLYVEAYSLKDSQITMRQGTKMTTLTIRPKLPSFGLDGEKEDDVFVLDETGTTHDFKIVLLDETGSVLPLSEFRTPDLIARKWNENPWFHVREFFNVSYEVDDGEGVYVKYVSNSFGPLEGEDYLITVRAYGLESDNGKTRHCNLTVYDDNNSQITVTFAVDVQPAFADQGYKGEIMNYQIAPGTLQSNTALSPVMFDSDTAIRKYGGRKYPADDNLEECFEYGTDQSMLSVDGRTITFRDPEYSSDPFFASGSYVVRKKAINTYTGKSYYGYYSFDVILYMSVIGELDLVPDSVNRETSVYLNYVPYCRFSTKDYSDYWNDSGLDVFVRNDKTGNTGSIKVSNLHSGIVKMTVGGSLSNTSSYSMLEKTFGNEQDYAFHFYNPATDTVSATCEKTRSMLGERDTGSIFYKVERQCDKDAKISGYLIEQAYGNFADY